MSVILVTRLMDKKEAKDLLLSCGATVLNDRLGFDNRERYFIPEVENNVDWLIERYNLTDFHIRDAILAWLNDPKGVANA